MNNNNNNDKLERRDSAITAFMSTNYLKEGYSMFNKRTNDFKDVIIIGHQQQMSELEQKIRNLEFENQKIQLKNKELTSILATYRDHLRSFNPNDQLLKNTEQISHEWQNIDTQSKLKTEPQLQMMKNYKRELDYERERNLELEKIVKKLERELANYKSSTLFLENTIKNDPSYAQSNQTLNSQDGPTRGYHSGPRGYHPGSRQEVVSPQLYEYYNKYIQQQDPVITQQKLIYNSDYTQPFDHHNEKYYSQQDYYNFNQQDNRREIAPQQYYQQPNHYQYYNN